MFEKHSEGLKEVIQNSDNNDNDKNNIEGDSNNYDYNLSNGYRRSNKQQNTYHYHD